MSLFNLLNYLPVFICLTGVMSEGCGQAPAADAPTAPVTVTQDENPITLPTDPQTVDPVTPAPLPPAPPGVSTFQLTYYRAAKTVAPVTGWPTKTYTATGSCVVYNSNTYCWDDGLKTLQWAYNGFVYGPFDYSFFRMGYASNGNLVHCNGSPAASGGCANDFMTTPTIIAGALPLNIASGSVNAVMAGTPVTVTCLDANGTLSCGDFSVDLNQAVVQ